MRKFGPFLHHNNKSFNVRNIEEKLNDVTLEIAIGIIESSDSIQPIEVSKNTILRYIDNDTSIRQGKYGKPYIFH